VVAVSFIEIDDMKALAVFDVAFTQVM